MPLTRPRLFPLVDLLLLGLMSICTTALSAQTPFTLEQIMSSPFPHDLVAAMHGSRVAWVFNTEGVRNMWVADGPDFIHAGSGLLRDCRVL